MQYCVWLCKLCVSCCNGAETLHCTYAKYCSLLSAIGHLKMFVFQWTVNGKSRSILPTLTDGYQLRYNTAHPFLRVC